KRNAIKSPFFWGLFRSVLMAYKPYKIIILCYGGGIQRNIKYSTGLCFSFDIDTHIVCRSAKGKTPRTVSNPVINMVIPEGSIQRHKIFGIHYPLYVRVRK